MKRLVLALGIGFAVSGHALANGDAVKGEKVFKRCMACHAVDDATNKVGPSLKGVAGRLAGSVEGYAYSADLAQMKSDGKKWDDTLLDAYLTNPKAIAPGGKMAFGGIKKPEDRADLIAYLKSK